MSQSTAEVWGRITHGLRRLFVQGGSVKIRFLESIASSRWSYDAGQVVEVMQMTPLFKSFLRPRQGGRPPVAELVRDDSPREVALAPDAPERPTIANPRRRTMRRNADDDLTTH